MLAVVIDSGTIALFIAAVVLFSGVGYYIGRLSARTTALERLVEGHYKTITEKIDSLNKTFTELHKNVNGLRNDLNKLIEEILKSRSNE